MWKGTYQRWNPVPALEGVRMYLEALHDDWDGFRIWFRPERNDAGVYVVRFDDNLVYTQSDEGDRLSSVENSRDMKLPHLFWKVEGSSLVQEFKRQAVPRNDQPIVHYAFLAANECIDVLALNEPTVTVPGHAL